MRKAKLKRMRRRGRNQRGQSWRLKENAWSSCVIYYTFDPRRSIWVYPSNNDDLLYFIVFNHNDETKATKAARISCYAPEYIECRDDGRISWILNKEEKEWLVSVLAPELWDFLIDRYYYNKDCILDPPTIPMPNYMELPER